MGLSYTFSFILEMCPGFRPRRSSVLAGGRGRLVSDALSLLRLGAADAGCWRKRGFTWEDGPTCNSFFFFFPPYFLLFKF